MQRRTHQATANGPEISSRATSIRPNARSKATGQDTKEETAILGKAESIPPKAKTDTDTRENLKHETLRTNPNVST